MLAARPWSAPVRVLVNEFREALQVVAGRLGKDTMSEVEDVTGLAVRVLEDRSRFARDHLERREHDARIEVALDAPVADPAPGLVKGQPPVDADDVRAAARHRLEQV